jgi:AmmeMemoRadiSam system protein B
MELKQIRKYAVAGQWYPSDKKTLLKILQEIDNQADTNYSSKTAPLGLIAPHAGYVYSGRTAAKGFKALSKEKYDTVIVLGTSHRFNNGSIALFDGDEVETPLGNLSIDKDLTKTILLSHKVLSSLPQIHEKEHSLEAMFPFIHFYLNAPSIVLVLTATNDEESLEEFGFALADTISKSSKKILVVASTDMSHFHPYEEALTMDKAAVSYIESGDFVGLISAIHNETIELCGYHALLPFFIAMRQLGSDKGQFLFYENSGDAVPETKAKGVVGYFSMIFSKDKS